MLGANGLYLVFRLADTGLDIGVLALGGEYLFLGADKRSIRDVVFGLCVLTEAVPTLFQDGGLGLGGDFLLGVVDLPDVFLTLGGENLLGVAERGLEDERVLEPDLGLDVVLGSGIPVL